MEFGLIPVIPLTFAFFLPITAVLTRRRRWLINAYAITATGLIMFFTAFLAVAAYRSGHPLVYPFGGWIAPVGIVFEVDRFSALLALTATVGFFLTTVYAVEYLSREHGVEYFFTGMLGLEAGTLGALMTGDAFNLFVMLEVIGASAYFIVGFYRYRGESVEGAFKYAMSGAVATSLYFLALGFVYSSLGTLNMADISAEFHGVAFPLTTRVFGDPKLAVGIFLALTVAMVLVKSAVFPGHYWLPDAYEGAPIPAAALLSGFVEVVGIYVLARYLFTVFAGPPYPGRLSLVFFTLGTISSFLGAFMMLVQRNLKRLIAYSTILNMGYLFMALGAMSKLALVAVTYHIINHAIAKTLLFFAAGSYIFATGTADIGELAGVGRSMPLTTAVFGVATLSLVGVPPLNVFFGKMLIYDALLERSPWLASVVVITSAVAAWAYFRAMVTIWRGKAEAGHEIERGGGPEVGHERPVFLLVMLPLALAVVVLGLLSPIIVDRFILPAAGQAMNYGGYIRAVLELVRGVL